MKCLLVTESVYMADVTSIFVPSLRPADHAKRGVAVSTPREIIEDTFWIDLLRDVRNKLLAQAEKPSN